MSTLNKNPKPEADDDDKSENAGVDALDNEIFFYSGVDNLSVLHLNKQISRLNYQIQMATYDFQLKYPAGFQIPLMPINLRINSFGGSVFAGFSAADAIRNSKAPVFTIIDGAAASAATFISVSGHRRLMTRNSHALIHQLSTGFWGTFESLKDEIENSNSFMERINSFYIQNTKIPKKILLETLKRDLWFDSKTCLKYGIVDEIIDGE